jgi:hypothetical protein
MSNAEALWQRKYFSIRNSLFDIRYSLTSILFSNFRPQKNWPKTYKNSSTAATAPCSAALLNLTPMPAQGLPFEDVQLPLRTATIRAGRSWALFMFSLSVQSGSYSWSLLNRKINGLTVLYIEEPSKNRKASCLRVRRLHSLFLRRGNHVSDQRSNSCCDGSR